MIDVRPLLGRTGAARISPDCRSVTIHDVAARAEVSKSTVSLVLQGSELITDA